MAQKSFFICLHEENPRVQVVLRLIFFLYLQYQIKNDHDAKVQWYRLWSSKKWAQVCWEINGILLVLVFQSTRNSNLYFMFKTKSPGLSTGSFPGFWNWPPHHHPTVAVNYQDLPWRHFSQSLKCLVLISSLPATGITYSTITFDIFSFFKVLRLLGGMRDGRFSSVCRARQIQRQEQALACLLRKANVRICDEEPGALFIERRPLAEAWLWLWSSCGRGRKLCR